jgi:hypothetical protein
MPAMNVPGWIVTVVNHPLFPAGAGGTIGGLAGAYAWLDQVGPICASDVRSSFVHCTYPVLPLLGEVSKLNEATFAGTLVGVFIGAGLIAARRL